MTNSIDITVPTVTKRDFTNTYSTTLLQLPSFIAVSSYIIDHIINTNLLTPSEKIYYLVNDLYQQSFKYWKSESGKRYSTKFKYSFDEVKFSASKIGASLDFSRSKIFTIQRKLETLEYIQITRSINQFGMNNINIPSTTLPKNIFSQMMDNIKNKSTSAIVGNYEEISLEQRRDIISQTKQFIPLNFQLFRFIFFNKNLSCNSKLLYLKLFCVIHKIKKKYNYPIYAGGIETNTLLKECNISRSTLIRCMKQLQNSDLIKCEKIKTESDIESSNRFDKIINYIQILVPKELEHILLNNNSLNTNSNTEISANIITDNAALNNKTTVSKEDPVCVKIIPSILINKTIRKIDKEKIDKKEKIENTKTKDFIETNKSISNFSKDSSNFKDEELSQQNTEKKQTKSGGKKSLSDFFPLTANDCSQLQTKSGKDFNLNAINQILKSLINKNNNPVFYAKRNFIAYMTKILQHELRIPSKVNNDGFRILINLTESERKIYESKIYLDHIEISQNISADWQLKKRLASSSLDSVTACELIKNYKAIGIYETKAVIELYRHVELTEIEKNIILEEVSDLHIKIGFNSDCLAIRKLEFLMPPKKLEKENSKSTVPLRTGIWGDIRTKIAECLGKDGDAIDANCFSRLYAEIDEQTKQIKLRASSRLYRNYIYDNYVEQIDEATISCSFTFEGIYSEDDPDKIFTVWRKQN